MKQRLFHPFIYLLSIFMIVLSSCVGTIEDTGEPNTEAEGGKVIPAKYTGIMGVKAISDTRVEIYFQQAPGTQSNYVYEIYKDKSKVPIEVRFDALRRSSTGLLTYTYQGLDPSTTYAFSVEFYDLSKSVRSRSSNPALNATTLSNQMCDFDGIVDARNANGLASLSTINVYWFPAKDSGFVVSSEDYDPVRYEIIAISESDGGIQSINDPAAERKVVTVDADTSFTSISGLAAGEKYFFQVRCLHTGWKNKGYLDFSETTIGTYSREANNRFIEIETKAAGKTPEFDGNVSVLNPLNAVQANTQLSIQWLPATGGFSDYRVFYYRDDPGVQIGPGEYDEAAMNSTDHLTDALMDEMVGNPVDYTTPCLVGTPTCGHEQVPAEDISTTLTSLTQYGFYQIKVAACTDAACTAATRIPSQMYLKRVVPNLIPFNGIVTITDPNPVVDDTLVTLNFAAPIKSAGFASEMVVRCYQGVDDPAAETFIDDSDGATPGTAIDEATKAECDNLALQTDLPTWADMDDLEEIDIVGVEVNANRNYCFSVYPVIDNTVGGLRYVLSGEENAIIQCITPSVKGPTVQEFAGRRIDICEYDEAANTLKVKWFEPTGGFYTDFKVFWKEFDPASSNPDIAGPLNFQKGIDGDADYSNATVAGNLKEYTIASTELIPGRKYSVGVLPTFTLNAVDQYGEFNTNTRECEIALPKVDFNEWTNIVAIGPKVDGRRPSAIAGFPDTTWTTPRIFETLDEFGIPLEVELEDNSNDPVDTSLRGNDANAIFNGVYGKKNANDGFSDGPHLYSNSGIIRIEFKDFLVDENGADPSFYDDKNSFHLLREYYVDNFSDYTRDTEGFDDGTGNATNAINKVPRKIGYKVFRSEDNRLSWVDLTQKSNKNLFQKTNNEGLIYSKPVMHFKKNGQGRVTGERRIRFTDYSVKHIEDDGGIVSRGRVYWYKIVPYIDGKPLEFKSSNSQHMVRVVLPPPNMAFVSRMMANRQACIELGKEDEIRKDDGQFYSCPYNGIGARGFSRPWNTNDTYLDLGGDLLVDRYELGCNWSRGDATEGSPDSSFLTDESLGDNGALNDIYKNFEEDKGLNGAVEMKGCFQVKAQKYDAGNQYNNGEPTNMSPHNNDGITEDVGGEQVLISTQLEYDQVLPGDCFGSGERTIYTGTAQRCHDIESDPARQGSIRGQTLIYPGAFENTGTFLGVNTCQDAMTAENHNAHPSLAYNNDQLTTPNDAVTNMDPYQAHSEYGAVFYMRKKVNGAGGLNGLRTLRRYFSNNSASDSENRYLATANRYNPSSCFINLYGVNKEASGVSTEADHATDVRPRWLSLSEVMRDMEVRDVARDVNNNVIAGAKISDVDALYNRTLSSVLNDDDLYGGDWDPPSRHVADDEGRVTQSMTIGRIMTSNAAKLPQIESLEHDEYHKLCQLYSVEVGYVDSGDNFVRDYPSIGEDPVKKRLARRKEFVAFSAWPDTYDEATIISLEKGDSNTGLADIIAALSDGESTVTGEAIDPSSPNADPALAAIEASYLAQLSNWESASCITRAKYSDSSHRSDNFYNADYSAVGKNRFKKLHPTFPLDENTDDPFLWTGSSSLDDSNYNSERCVSRYGIQDAVGNYREVGSDQFWCDPDAHEFQILGTNTINLVEKGFQYFKEDNFPNFDDQRDNTGVPFGECSVRGRGNGVGDPVTQSSNMVSIYTDFTQQNYNTGLLPKINNIDPESVLALRNGGDGGFLSFGNNSIVPNLYHSKVANGDNLSLQNTNHSDAYYFSPVLGMPLKCSATSCATSEDNLLATSNIFHNNLKTATVIAGGLECEDQLPDGASPDAAFKVRECDFPLGNADINNYSTDAFYTDSWSLYQTSNPQSSSNNYSVVFNDDYYIDADGTGAPIYQSDSTNGLPVDTNGNGVLDDVDGDAWINSLDPDELSGADFVKLTRIRPRDLGQAGMFINGGGTTSDEDRPGRYALNILMDDYLGSEDYQYSTRCMLMIYGSDY